MPTNNAAPTRPSTSTHHPSASTVDAFTARFTANPALTVNQLMNLNRAATYDAEAVNARNAAALDRESDARPGPVRSLPGDIVVRRNSTMTPRVTTGADLLATPTRSDLAAICAAEDLIHELFAAGVPATLADRADTIAYYSAQVTTRWAGNGLDRRGPRFADAAAQYATSWCHPTDLVFAPRNQLRKWYGTICEDLDEVTRTDATLGAATPSPRPGLDASFIVRRRIAWTRPTGPDAGLLLDRVHTASRPGGVARDQWIHRKVAADLTDAATFLAPATTLAGDPTLVQRALLGVRVLTPRATNVGVHFTPAFTSGGVPVVGSHHPLGNCAVCATTPQLPTPTITPTPTLTTALVGASGIEGGHAR